MDICFIFARNTRSERYEKLMWRRQNESSDFIADVLCRTGTGQQGNELHLPDGKRRQRLRAL